MRFFRSLIFLLIFAGFSYAQPFFAGKGERIIILGENVYFGKFFFFKKSPVRMINLPGGFILKVKSDKCPLGFVLAERKYIQGYYDIKLEPVNKEGKCITYVGNIPERKLIKDLTIGQLVLTYCEMDSYLNCDRGEIYWELYYFPSEESK